MEQIECVSPCHFGLEAVLKRELKGLGINVSEVTDGRVSYSGDISIIPRANIFLRTAERVMLKCKEFEARTFDELYENTKAVHWEDYFPADGRFWVAKASSVRSKLFSPRDIQSIMKKAMVDRMMAAYHVNTLPETGASFPLRVMIKDDTVTVCLDTSGESLHKRGYRTSVVKAPISETLASALIMLTPWKHDRILADPFCGSGTFPIEAAMIGCNMAPGLNRSFISEDWTDLIPKKYWYQAVDEASSLVVIDHDMDIQGFDIDGDAVRTARINAQKAGVADLIHLQQKDVSAFSHHGRYGFMITNPPYGERLEEKKDLPVLYKQIGEVYRRLDCWSLYLITSYDQAEKYLGRKADKNRKIYNGMIQTRFYHYRGPAPHSRKP
ncbi:MAG: class I SAM-dependent RNA methyltransferase [Lachnospiraceae bacterium]|nr:class I SAM-dependent RNA methyltransferase [Lachnospiraceae bacterium]MEE3460785.1 class I SAM-dependent RNA methyltransferase [Lachnospiraceae bacterium]